jgi:hypothetical protein
MSPTTALALRRLAVAAGALAASLLAHCATLGDVAIMPSAPVVWTGLLAGVTLVGRRRGWRRLGFGPNLLWMASAQAVVHVAMSGAPWAFGLAPHHEPGLGVGISVLVAHAGAALVLAALLTWLEAGLERATALVLRVRRWLAGRPLAPAASRLAGHTDRAPRSRPPGRVPCRGPPALRSA